MLRDIQSLENLFWYVSIVGFVLILLRLSWSRLLSVYRYLAIFAAAQLLQNLFLLWIVRFHRGHYNEAYAFSSPPVWITYILVVLELYNVALQKYEGIARLSRQVFRVFLVIAIGASLLTLIPEPHESVRRMTKFAALSLVERGVVSSLLFFLIMISGFLLWFPVRLTKNAISHTGFCCAFFVTIAAGLFFRDTVGTGSTRIVSTVMLGVSSMCLPWWAFLLTSSGERIALTSRPTFAPEQEAVLTRQLEAFNSALLRSTRR